MTTFIAFDAFTSAHNANHCTRTQAWDGEIEATDIDAALAIAVKRAHETTHVVVVEMDEDGFELDERSARVADQHEDDDGYVTFTRVA